MSTVAGTVQKVYRTLYGGTGARAQAQSAYAWTCCPACCLSLHTCLRPHLQESQAGPACRPATPPPHPPFGVGRIHVRALGRQRAAARREDGQAKRGEGHLHVQPSAHTCAHAGELGQWLVRRLVQRFGLGSPVGDVRLIKDGSAGQVRVGGTS